MFIKLSLFALLAAAALNAGTSKENKCSSPCECSNKSIQAANKDKMVLAYKYTAKAISLLNLNTMPTKQLECGRNELQVTINDFIGDQEKTPFDDSKESLKIQAAVFMLYLDVSKKLGTPDPLEGFSMVYPDGYPMKMQEINPAIAEAVPLSQNPAALGKAINDITVKNLKDGSGRYYKNNF